MRAPKGFGKNYFTLAAIQAYSSAAALQGAVSRTHAVSEQRDRESETEAEADDSPDALLCTVTQPLPHPSGSRHCNCYYKRKTRNIIKNHPLPKQYRRPYKLTNSNLSPPPCLYPSHENINTSLCKE